MWKYYLGIPVAVVVIAVGYYAISPLFRNIEANDVLPGATYAPEMRMDEQMPAVQQPASSVSTTVVGTLGHPASGTARLVEADGKQFLRYENFKTINGPDIYVYLSKDLEATEFIDLGRVRATEGNINYEIPAGVDPLEYPYALTWCKAFGVLFNSAKLY